MKEDLQDSDSSALLPIDVNGEGEDKPEIEIGLQKCKGQWNCTYYLSRIGDGLGECDGQSTSRLWWFLWSM